MEEDRRRKEGGLTAKLGEVFNATGPKWGVGYSAKRTS